MSGPRAEGDLAAQLEHLRSRIDRVTATVLDKELWARLSPIREHLSTTAVMLGDSAQDTLVRVAERLRVAERELAAVLKLPRASR